MFREDTPNTAAAAEADLRPLTERWPTQYRRGLFAFKQCPPPPAVITPLPARWPSLRDVVALRIRMAGELVGHRHHISRAQGELQDFPAMNMQGALMDTQLLDTLCFFATKQLTGTPRTGASTLIRPMAEKRGWKLTKEVPDPQAGPDAVKVVPRSDSDLIDAHAGTIADARWRLEQMGLLGNVRSAIDEHGQERATDWELVDVPEISPEEYAAADAAIERYLQRTPAHAARPLSARLRGQRFWHFKRRIRQRLTPEVYARKNRSAPLPAARAPLGPKQPQITAIDESSCHAGANASNDPSGRPKSTRSTTSSAPTQNPREGQNSGSFTEKKGPASAASGVQDNSSTALLGCRDGQQRYDTGQGVKTAHEVRIFVQGEDLQSILSASERSALSPKAAAKLGATLRLARTRLGMSADDVARALARLMNEDPTRRLSHAAAILRHDLRHHPAMPGAAARARRREQTQQRRAELLENTPIPPFVRTGDHANPVIWAPDGRAGNLFIACTTLPHDLNDPAVRRGIHAAAHRAGITEPQRLQTERDNPHGVLNASKFTLEQRLRWEHRFRRTGCVHVIALDGSGAIVPPETSTAATVRWQRDAQPTDHQWAVYQWLIGVRRQRHAATEFKDAGAAAPTIPSTFTAMWHAIAELLAELYPTQPPPAHEHRPPTTAPPASPEISRGRALILQHGGRAAALFATHPDHGGNAGDLRAVLAALHTRL